MRKSLRALYALLFCFSLVPALAAPLAAQVRIPAAAMPDEAALDQVVAVGDGLERQRRWGEALLHYEQAVRQHPGHEELSERLVQARLHYEVARRYHDASFVNTLDVLREPQALDLYGEVLLKIHTYYVQTPDWGRLVERGVDAINIALTEPAFLDKHQVAVDATQRAALVDAIRVRQPVYSRHDAREAVRASAYVIQRELGVPASVSIMEYACAATASLDDYSAFLTDGQLDEVMSQIEGNFVGLGIELRADDNTLLILNVISGGPADEGGVRPGDRIVAVDGRSTHEVSTDTAADMLKGVDGSRVEVVLQDARGTLRRLHLQRRRVDVPSVDAASIVDPEYGVAYMRLTSFQKTTSRDVEAALWRLHREGMRTLIVDVRGNPGGLLTSSVQVADKFIPDGSIVSTVGRSSGENYDHRAHAPGTWRVPLVVMIDGESASASEIFAGAIRDHRRGVVVGTRSFGKGSVQGIFPLEVAKGGIRLTTAKFYSPSGQAISLRGVHPDVVVRSAAKPVPGASAASGEDQTLNAAIQVARQQLREDDIATAGGRSRN